MYDERELQPFSGQVHGLVIWTRTQKTTTTVFEQPEQHDYDVFSINELDIQFRLMWNAKNEVYSLLVRTFYYQLTTILLTTYYHFTNNCI